jgi:hypothetical protein
MLCTRRRFALIAATTAISGCSSWPESTFDLAPESRLPIWLHLPKGTARSRVSVQMSYYIVESHREAKFELFKGSSWPWRIRVQHVRGVQRGDSPIYLPSSGLTGFGKDPSYEIVTVGTQTDIVEHRRQEPIFYMVEDKEIFREFNVPTSGIL